MGDIEAGAVISPSISLVRKDFLGFGGAGGGDVFVAVKSGLEGRSLNVLSVLTHSVFNGMILFWL